MKQFSSLLLLFLWIWLSLISSQCHPPKEVASMAYISADSVVITPAAILVVAGHVGGIDSQLNVIKERLETIDRMLDEPKYPHTSLLTGEREN